VGVAWNIASYFQFTFLIHAIAFSAPCFGGFLVRDNLIGGDERRAALARGAARVHSPRRMLVALAFSAEIGGRPPGLSVGATLQTPPRQSLADKGEPSPEWSTTFY
jgi:hypothetical protein